jgi:putative ABC transport system permease protein
MLFHAFLKFYRSLARHCLYAVLNVLGLAIGIAVFLMLTLAVRSEDGFDRWTPDAAKIYQVDNVRSRLGQTRPPNVGAMLAAFDPPGTDNIRIETGTQAPDRGHTGRRIEMLVGCTAVLFYHVV